MLLLNGNDHCFIRFDSNLFIINMYIEIIISEILL